MLMLRKAELMMVLAAGSNVRIRTEHGGRFTSTRALPYFAHTYNIGYMYNVSYMHLHCTHLHLHTCCTIFIFPYMSM